MIEKMRFLVAFVTIVALMAVALMPVDMALGKEVNPARTLPEAVHKGETFDVTVTFTAPADRFNAISITDLAPEDWNVTVSTAWCTPTADVVLATGNKTEIAWYGEHGVGFDNGTSFSVLYKVAVPDDASTGIHTFSGFLGYYIGPSEHIFENVTGASKVEVVLAATPIISFSPTSLSFSVARGGSNPANQTLEIWNSGIDTISWTLTDDAGWLSENPTSGSSTGEHDTVVLSVDITGMSDGAYSTSITITASGASNSPQTVPVTLYVGGIGPPFTITGLDVTPEQVPPGQPVTVSAQVTNTGDSGGSYTVNLTVNGQVEQTKTVTLAPEVMETVTFTVTKETPGSYTISIGDLTEEFTVAAPSWLNRYWWTIVAGIVGVVILVYLLRRRRGA